MNLPKKIKVAGFDIQVEEWSPHKANTAKCFGEFVPLETIMRIDVSIDKYKIVDTLIHEIIHAIYWAYGLRDEDNEEQNATVMSSAWTQVFRDNPELLQFIVEKLNANQQTDTAT